LSPAVIRSGSFTVLYVPAGGAPAEACTTETSLTGGDWCNIPLTAQQNGAGGLDGFNFVLNHARAAGVPI